ncbi:MAG: hypothetical protein QOG79_1722 [Mycobacterium sp.]|jgi:hypothetical protein|nr:hypothetical protein [Mycobacterium sp.]MDT5291108.1 hypothetical protein [Mycobacterium sp.]MDT5298480.1 hypothetical protein [Mycobacterium sp.]
MSIPVRQPVVTHERYQPQSAQDELCAPVAMKAAVTNRFEATQDEP